MHIYKTSTKFELVKMYLKQILLEGWIKESIRVANVRLGDTEASQK